MTFKSKIDLPYSILIFISITILVLVCMIPFIIDGTDTFFTAFLLIGVTSPFMVLLILMLFNTRYVFHNDFLHVKSLIFGSKIPYQAIFKVNETSNFLSGYRVMTSKDGLEIHARSIGMGSVKISPDNKSLFLQELMKRAPHADYKNM